MTAATANLSPTSQSTRAGHVVPVMLWVATIVVVSIAAWLYSGAVHRAVMFDEADYAIAANHGVIANALDSDYLNRDVRHRHGPLSFYAIYMSILAFGMNTWAVRLPGIIISAVSSGLAVWIGYDLAVGSRRARCVTGVLAGLLMATAPAAVLMTNVARPHPFVAFFLLLNIWCLCRYLLGPTTRRAVYLGLSLAGQFVSMEYGPIVVGLSVVAIAIVQPAGLGLCRRWPVISVTRRFPFVAVHRHVWVTLGVCLGGIAVVWPGGLLRLHVLLNFAYYVLYAKGGHRTLFRGQIYQHVPKYAYTWWYGAQYPLLLAAMLIAIVLIVVWAWRVRGPVAVTIAVFTLGLGAAVHGSHIMELCYSLFMIPPLVLGGPLAGAWVIRSFAVSQWHREGMKTVVWLPGSRLARMSFVVLAVAAVLGGQTQPAVSNDNANTKLVTVSRELARIAEPGDHVLAQAWPIVRFELLRLGRDDVTVHRYDPVHYESDHLQDRIDAGRFDWVITAGSTARAHPDCPVLSQLHKDWRVVVEAALPPAEYRLYGSPVPTQAMTLIDTPGNVKVQRPHGGGSD